ncbi:MAG TPA: LptF/LptG family permease [Azospirillaceae bacterium]|nr:LptF/LptG family permease [Azospirillaceae bacterium]
MNAATLSRYLFRQYMLLFLATLMGLFALVMLLDGVELLRRAANRDVPVGVVMVMTVLKLPEIGFQMFPFAVLFSAMFLFWKMTRSRELIVVRAFGISAWQFLAPVVAAAAMVGVLQILFVNPTGALMLGRFEQLESRYLQGRGSLIEVGRSGIWLSQRDEASQALIHAETMTGPERELQPVTVIVLRGFNQVSLRIEGQGAVLEPGAWRIRDAWVHEAGRPSVRHDIYRLPTDLTMERIESSFAPPETIGFWDLPQFIRSLEAAGLSALRHRLHYQSMLTQPVVFAAMVLFAAAFTLRLSRRGSPMFMIVSGVATGFLLFLLRDVVLALGGSETLPVAVAAWAPAVAGLLIGTAAILHLEDG